MRRPIALHCAAIAATETRQCALRGSGTVRSQLAAQQEAEEFTIAQESYQLYALELTASSMLGCWTVQYPDPGTALSLIIPTGKQQGYLRSLTVLYPLLPGWHLRKKLCCWLQDDDLPNRYSNSLQSC